MWSGVRGGGCLLFVSRGRSIGFDVGVAVLGGGTVPTIDVTVPLGVTIGLVGDERDGGQLSLRLGATAFGGSLPTDASVGSPYVRMGFVTGLVYDLELSDAISLRVLEASFFSEGRLGGAKHPAPFDRSQDANWDIGLQLGTGILFH